MLNIDEQVTTLFYWFLKFRFCPTCNKPWVHHKDPGGQSEAWDHLGDFIAKKVIEQSGGKMKVKPAVKAVKSTKASAKVAAPKAAKKVAKSAAKKTAAPRKTK